MIFLIRRKIIGWFLLGLTVVAFALVVAADKLGINGFDVRFLILAGLLVGLVLQILYYLFLILFRNRKYKTVDAYLSKRTKEDITQASNMYPIKHLQKGTPEFDIQFQKNLSYLEVLQNESKELTKKKFNLSKEDWDRYLIKSITK